MRTAILTLAAVTLWTGVASAQTLKSEHPVCATEDLLDEIQMARVDNDERTVQYLMKQGCVKPQPGLPISIIERTWGGNVKVRIYMDDGEAVVAWTDGRNIVE